MNKQAKLSHSSRTFAIAIGLLLLYIVVVKVLAAHRLGYIGDEPDDFANIVSDISKAANFFHGALSPDQARLPHLLTAPILLFGTSSALLAGRLISIIASSFFLITIFKILKLKLTNLQAFFGLTVVGLSSYLFSFSFFAMTSSNSLYMLFGALSVYYYLKYFVARQRNTVAQLTVLGCLLGLTVASKLFGLLILGSLFIYDAGLHYKQGRSWLSSKSSVYLDVPLARLNIYFTLSWLIINVLPLPATVQLLLMLLTCLAYVVFAYKSYHLNKNKIAIVAFIPKWLLIIHTAFVVSIIGSPIYFNIENILGVLKWSHTWNSADNIVNPSKFDSLDLIGIKFGLFATVYLVIALVILYRRRQLKKFVIDYGLLILLFAVHMLVFLESTFFVAWYPLFIFWMLYVPLCYIVPKTFKPKVASNVVVCLVLFALPVYEQIRYWRIFPYGHTDGAQRGSQDVGWNKSGFITFEGIPLLKDFLLQNQQELPKGSVDCFLVMNQRYNNYAIHVLNNYFVDNGLSDFQCTTLASSGTSLYRLTSVYSGQNTVTQTTKYYEIKKQFMVNTVPVSTLWQKK